MLHRSSGQLADAQATVLVLEQILSTLQFSTPLPRVHVSNKRESTLYMKHEIIANTCRDHGSYGTGRRRRRST